MPEPNQIPQNEGQMDVDGAASGNKDLDPQQMIDSFFQGIPNQDVVPTLHAITCRKMAVLQCPDLLDYCNFDKE
jgi:hypothetical protein